MNHIKSYNTIVELEKKIVKWIEQEINYEELDEMFLWLSDYFDSRFIFRNIIQGDALDDSEFYFLKDEYISYNDKPIFNLSDDVGQAHSFEMQIASWCEYKNYKEVSKFDRNIIDEYVLDTLRKNKSEFTWTSLITIKSYIRTTKDFDIINEELLSLKKNLESIGIYLELLNIGKDYVYLELKKVLSDELFKLFFIKKGIQIGSDGKVKN